MSDDTLPVLRMKCWRANDGSRWATEVEAEARSRIRILVLRKDVKTIQKWLRSNASHGDICAIIEKMTSRWLTPQTQEKKKCSR